MSPPSLLVLASGSPRRRELLISIGLPHEVVVPGVTEPAPGSLPPLELAGEAARLKARAVAASHPGRLVLAADTIVVVGEPASGEVLGKPANAREAESMLRRLSGREHVVLTAVCLARDARLAEALSETRVRFAELTEAFLERYLATGESLDKAGGYGAQGFAGTQVQGISGSWTNVVGLPLERLPALFREQGEELADRQDW